MALTDTQRMPEAQTVYAIQVPHTRHVRGEPDDREVPWNDLTSFFACVPQAEAP